MEWAITGKTCLITGGTRGLGRATALALARLGATVVITGRVSEAANAVADQLRQETGNAQVHGLGADLAEQADVHALAVALKARFELLHVLIHNAGQMALVREVTGDGLERTLAVNHLAPFLLTALLRDRLWASAPARVIAVSSYAHRFGRPSLDDLQLTAGYSMDRAYYQSKAANVLFSHELARRWSGRAVTSNCLEPGQMRTDMAWSYPGWKGWVNRYFILPLFGYAPEESARTCVHLATAPALQTVSGGYFANSKPVRPAAFTRDAALAQALWTASTQLTGADPATELTH